MLLNFSFRVIINCNLFCYYIFLTKFLEFFIIFFEIFFLNAIKIFNNFYNCLPIFFFRKCNYFLKKACAFFAFITHFSFFPFYFIILHFFICANIFHYAIHELSYLIALPISVNGKWSWAIFVHLFVVKSDNARKAAQHLCCFCFFNIFDFYFENSSTI